MGDLDEVSDDRGSESPIGNENKTMDVNGVIKVIRAIKVPRIFANPCKSP